MESSPTRSDLSSHMELKKEVEVSLDIESNPSASTRSLGINDVSKYIREYEEKS